MPGTGLSVWVPQTQMYTYKCTDTRVHTGCSWTPVAVEKGPDQRETEEAGELSCSM